MSTQPCTLRGNIPLSLEGVLDQDSILAFGARGKQGNRTTHEFLDSPDIFDGLCRQISPRPGMGGRLYRKKQRVIIKWAIIAALFVCVIVAVLMYMLSQPNNVFTRDLVP